MEIWDLYTADRQKTDRTAIRGEPLPANHCHLVVHSCLFNSAGQMLIQQRQPFKQGWPNLWDVTAGGSALAGETSQAAMARELREEIGLALNFEGIRPHLTLNCTACFQDVYLLEREVDIASLTLQYEEVQAVRWADAAEILRMIDKGAFVPYHKSLMQFFFDARQHEGGLSR